MKRREFLQSAAAAGAGLIMAGNRRAAAAANSAINDQLIGMYIHQHWPYKHPYAARTWTIDDWRGYAEGLSKLGYNALLIWPVIDTMPDPPTESDRANIDKIARVIDVLHGDLGMRVYIVVCPNVVPVDKEAAKYPFEERHFFWCDARVNTADPEAVAKLMKRRERLLRPLAKADGLVISDSDPGGYPGSTNAEFVALLMEYRKLMDRLRPGMEFWYFIHAGWEAYSRFYATGKFTLGTDEEIGDAVRRLQQADPKPWGLAKGLHYKGKYDIGPNVLGFNYGAIEGEPSFPLTNFGSDFALTAGAACGPAGVVGNAQTHCVQLPNTFAYVRGAKGLPADRADYVQFADDLIPDKGQESVAAWECLAGEDSGAMRMAADRMERLGRQQLRGGPLKGLLFDDPRRFVADLAMQLRMKAAFQDFMADTREGRDVRRSFREFVAAARVWQSQHGYSCTWGWPGLYDALRKLDSPAVDRVLAVTLLDWGADDADERARRLFKGATPFERIQASFREIETFTPRLLEAMEEAAKNMSD